MSMSEQARFIFDLALYSNFDFFKWADPTKYARFRAFIPATTNLGPNFHFSQRARKVSCSSICLIKRKTQWGTYSMLQAI